MGLFGRKLVFNREVARAVERLTDGNANAVTGAKALAQALGIRNVVASEVNSEVTQRNNRIKKNQRQVKSNEVTIRALQGENQSLEAANRGHRVSIDQALAEKEEWAW